MDDQSRSKFPRRRLSGSKSALAGGHGKRGRAKDGSKTPAQAVWEQDCLLKLDLLFDSAKSHLRADVMDAIRVVRDFLKEGEAA